MRALGLLQSRRILVHHSYIPYLPFYIFSAVCFTSYLNRRENASSVGFPINMFGCVTFLLLLITASKGEAYPDPAFVLIGPTGAGKSSLANAFLGWDPSNASCPFQVCEDDGETESCTKDTNIGTGKWLGSGSNLTVRFYFMSDLLTMNSSGSRHTWVWRR